MAARGVRGSSISGVPWLTAGGDLDLSRVPIDSVLKQAISPDDARFLTGCNLLQSMCRLGRVEAGVFLLGLLQHHPDNWQRLTAIAEALQSFPTRATVDLLAAELRRVKGASATRGYLRRILTTLEQFPAVLVEDRIEELAIDPRVGARFRQHLRAMLNRDFDA